MLRSHFNRSGAYIIGADGTILRSRGQRSSYPYVGAGFLGIDLGRRHAVPPVGGFVAAVLPGGSGYF